MSPPFAFARPSNRRPLFLLALLVALVCSLPASGQERAQGAASDAVKTLRDIVFARPDGKPLTLDLYLPREKSTAPRPLVVWVHGGAWRHGSKNRCPAVWLTDEGFAVASISYRLSQVAQFPAQIHDCQAAIRFLRQHATEYGIDPQRIGVWGSSAGGHLAALLGVAGDAPDLTGKHETSSAVQAVCDFFGPTDFLQMDAHSQPGAPIVHDAADSPESQLVGGAIQKHPERVARANPITYVTPSDPPFLIMHGDQDRLVPHHQSQILHDALQAAKVNTTLQIVPGAGHGLRGDRVRGRVREFFVAHLQTGAADKSDTPPYNPRTVIRRPFPTITDADFIKASEVTDQVRDNELVLGVVVNDVPRAYPINMLCGPTREIINDVLGGANIAATW